jgi:release factor glutamine methyltransferase
MDADYSIQGTELRLSLTDGVFHPSPFSMLLARGLDCGKAVTALDLGTGSGIQAILLAKLGVETVFAVDSSEVQVAAATANAAANGVADAVVTLQSDLFKAIDSQKFDLIVANPPTLPDVPTTPAGCRSGRNGRYFLDHLLFNSKKHLHPGGELQFVQSSLADVDMTVKILEWQGYRVVAKAREILEFRDFYKMIRSEFRTETIDGNRTYWFEGKKLVEEVVLLRAILE